MIFPKLNKSSTDFTRLWKIFYCIFGEIPSWDGILNYWGFSIRSHSRSHGPTFVIEGCSEYSTSSSLLLVHKHPQMSGFNQKSMLSLDPIDLGRKS